MLGVLHYLLILCFGIGQITSYEGIEGGCTVNLTVPNMPLVFMTGTTELYQLQGLEEILEFKTNDTVDFACPGSSILLKENDTKLLLVEATCDPHRIHSDNVKWTDITCKGPIEPMRQYEAALCGDEARNMSVFFRLGPNRFAFLYSICAISEKGITHYTYHEMSPIHIMKERNIKHQEHLLTQDIGEFSAFYGIQGQKMFNKKFQRKIINKQLKNYMMEDDEYIKDDDLNYFIMNFLIPAQDFYYQAYQNATYLLANTVAQWKAVSHNWEKIEDDVRQFSMAYLFPLKIWTGVLGQMALAKSYRPMGLSLKTKYVEIFLYPTKNSRRFIFPVPGLFWKLVYLEMGEKAIVLITVNNPHSKIDKAKQTICPDISENTGWMIWDKHNVTYGYSYACSYETFKRQLPYELSNLPISNLLVWEE